MKPMRMAAIALAAVAGLGLFALPQYLVAQPAPAVPSTATSPDRARIESVVREYLLANPQLLREMAEKLRAQDEAKATAARAGVFKSNADTVYNSDHQVVLGNPKGDVTLVEFFDYNCGYCKQALQDTEALLKRDPQLRLVLKEFPVLGQDSVDAARVAVAVHSLSPAKYLDFHRRLLNADSATGDSALAIARELGLDADRLSQNLASPNVEDNLTEVQSLARRLGISGTPTYVIADTVLPGAVGAEQLTEIIGNVRKCGKPECS